jgi:hypothetical protein
VNNEHYYKKNEIRTINKAVWQTLARIRNAIMRELLIDQLSGHIKADAPYLGRQQLGEARTMLLFT